MHHDFSDTIVSNDPWSPLAGGQDSSTVLGNDAWGAPASAVIPAAATSSSEAVGAGANNDLSIDPFSPMAQKELTDFDLLRNEIEGGTSSNAKANNGNGGV